MPALAEVAQLRLCDDAPLVRAMAVWALSRLMPQAGFTALAARHIENEEDADVLAEWRAGCEEKMV